MPDRKYETPPLEAQRRRHTELVDLFNEEAPRGRFGAVAQRLVSKKEQFRSLKELAAAAPSADATLVHLLAVETCAGLCGTNGQRGRPCGRSCRFLSCTSPLSLLLHQLLPPPPPRAAPAPAPARARPPSAASSSTDDGRATRARRSSSRLS